MKEKLEKEINFKLLEAEKELASNTKRYSEEEVVESINKIIDKDK